MKKIKKYEWGTFSASVDKPQMVNPGNAALQQYTMSSAQTAGMPIVKPSSANPNAKSLSDIKLPTSSPNKSSLGFKGFMGDYGNLIGNVGGTIATLIHANKKQDPTGRPYKKGSKLIKYQEGVDNLENKAKSPVQNKKTAKVNNKRVYPQESPLFKYRKGIPSKPATNVPTRVSANLYTPLFEMAHNARFAKKK